MIEAIISVEGYIEQIYLVDLAAKMSRFYNVKRLSNNTALIVLNDG